MGGFNGTISRLQLIDRLAVRVISSSSKSFLLSYIALVAPRFFNLCVQYSRKKNLKVKDVFKIAKHICRSELSRDQLPWFSAMLIGCSVATSEIISLICTRFGVLPKIRKLWLYFSLSAIGALVLRWHQRQQKCSQNRTQDTIDSTMYATSSALDHILNHSSIAPLASSMILRDTVMFSASAVVIMYSWFYYPDRLPKSYNTWITKFADMDPRLLEALRLVKAKKFIYGKDTGYADLLSERCEEYGLPRTMGDPAKVRQVPCIVIHENIAENCEIHALLRFERAFRSAMLIYIPLNLALVIKRRSVRSIIKSVRAAIRSSCFLASFTALTWYGVCLTRSRLGPFFFPEAELITFDDTTGPLIGSVLSGLSILIEKANRRGELALFVFPRALRATIPKQLSDSHKKLEPIIFGFSYSILYLSIIDSKSISKPRGLLSKAIKTVV
ncbi:hypothetical protein V1511DRAFT_528693 [Dipodascopsis uninucleata]